MLRSDWLSCYEAVCYSPLVAKSTSKATAEFKRNAIVKVVSFFFFPRFLSTLTGKGGEAVLRDLGLKRGCL